MINTFSLFLGQLASILTNLQILVTLWTNVMIFPVGISIPFAYHIVELQALVHLSLNTSIKLLSIWAVTCDKLLILNQNIITLPPFPVITQIPEVLSRLL